MLQKIEAIGNLIFQVADFLVKAIAAYSQTAQGAKEWGDVLAALTEVGALNPSDIQPVSPQSASAESVSASQPFPVMTVQEMHDLLAQQSPEGNITSDSRVVYAPKKHGRVGE